MKLDNANMDILMKDNQLEQFQDIRVNSTNMENLKEQIEEERSKFAQIMTNWAHEVS